MEARTRSKEMQVVVQDVVRNLSDMGMSQIKGETRSPR